MAELCHDDDTVPSPESMTSRDKAIDNDYYVRHPASWRDGSSPLSLLGGVTPARFASLRRVLIDRLGMDLRGTTVLDLGCGGGLLAEEFARAGCRVTGIDPAEPSLRVAREHAHQAGLTIDYRVGTGEMLPLEDGSFDIVYCCDVLEHVRDLEGVIAETARVLQPGGIYLYDTINRTLASKLVMIKLAQQWPPTRIVDFTLHNWEMFIKPPELVTLLAECGLENQELVGFGPRANPLTMIAAYVQLKRRRLTFNQMGQIMETGPIRSVSISYMGYAIKKAPSLRA